MRPKKWNAGHAALRPPRRPRSADVQPAASAGELALESRELWLAMHLPQLSSEAPLDERNRQKILERLAVQAQRFTPRVSLVPPDGLLLEVKGSLHLFGGAAGLCRALAASFQTAGLQALQALAPTPLAALAFARAGRIDAAVCMVSDPARLIGQLARLPLAVLRWPAEVLQRLTKVGVYTIGQALRLPRSGFARRFGAQQLAMLDRLTGRAADPQTAFKPRERFQRRGEFTFEIENQDLILKTIAPLLQELEAFLRARQSGITWLECRLYHRQVAATRCVLKLAAPAADAARLSVLLGERLMSVTLPEPVRACELRTGWLLARALDAQPLWQAGEHGGRAGGESPELVEYLRARLGAEAVYGLGIVPVHRPEDAWRRVEPGMDRDEKSSAALRRPLWLLSAPRVLPRESLRLLRGPERIETGWWNGADTERDYYTAMNERGVRLWVFRELASPRRWFLHGVFG